MTGYRGQDAPAVKPPPPQGPGALGRLIARQAEIATPDGPLQLGDGTLAVQPIEEQRTEQEGGWSFAGMGDAFDQHVVRHLPDYERVQELVGLVSQVTIPDGGLVVDLGASTGRTVQQIAERVPGRRMVAHLYDADPSMLDRARARLDPLAPRVVSCYHEGSLTDVSDPLVHTDADLTLALWLLQFLHPAERGRLLTRARERASEHGAILVAAKARFVDPRWQEIADAGLVDYKAAHGVEAGEQAAKTRSLRGALIPDTTVTTSAQLIAAGWHSPTVLMRWHVWTVIGAWATPLPSAGAVG